MDTDETTTPPSTKPKLTRESVTAKKLSPDGSRCLLMSPVKKLSALRLVSPIDSDQELNDLEVASVLGEGVVSIGLLFIDFFYAPVLKGHIILFYFFLFVLIFYNSQGTKPIFGM